MKANQLLLDQFHHEHSCLFVVERDGVQAAFIHWSQNPVFDLSRFHTAALVSTDGHPIGIQDFQSGYLLFFKWIEQQEQFIAEYRQAQYNLGGDIYAT